RAIQYAANQQVDCGEGNSQATVHVAATLDGRPWLTTSTSLRYGLVCPSRALADSAVPKSFSGLSPGQCMLTYQGGGPSAAALSAIGPCTVGGSACQAELNATEALAFTLQFKSNQPPTAGFTMSSSTSSALDGQTLSLTVPVGGGTSVVFDGTT